MKHLKKSILFMTIFFLCLAVFIEVFIFNFRSFQTLTYKPINENDYTVTCSPNATLTPNNVLPEKSILSFGDTDDCYLEICGLHEVVSNIYLKAISVNTDDEDVSITISAIDDGNAIYYDLPDSTIKENVVSSQYIKLNLSGQAYRLKITFNDANGKIFYLDNIQMNVHRPFDISVKRIVILFVVFMALYMMRPGSAIYTVSYHPNHFAQKVALIVLASLELLGIFKIATYNDNYINPPWTHHYQYAMLAEAITEGHFYLDETPDEALQSMNNPYDRYLREYENIDYLWDVAYHDGHYYVYFGIVPVLIFYLPYYVLTGNYFPTWWGIIITITAIVIGLMFLLNALIRKYFHHISLGLYILMDLFLLGGCGIFVIATNATFYQLPIAMGVAFTIWGLYLWISSEGKHIAQLIGGSLCMALVAGCRPQLLLGSFLALPLFLPDWILKFKQKDYKYVLSKLICALIPFIVVAAFLMYYNAARFGSPFDFGANYNLTTNDMTHRGFHLDRLWLGAYMYLFQPPCFSTAFPFIRYVPSNIHYQGTTILEHMYGGILWLNPLMFSMFLSIKKRQQLKGNQSYLFVWICIISGLIIAAADTQMAGILFRYLCDFGIFFSIATVLILLNMTEHMPSSDRSASLHWKKLLYIGCISGQIIWYLTIQYIITK